ncbi:hypothetical protein ACDW_14220 [Acidovorax sp. DW039]|uniref:hypothetical protein n=1 Tax=Acidovorax sp. DW039 TaxID=3095606 RepID=UPI0030874508|nr:hypothetical protein ACDW_14220 [Acidovorax sp. DW039]
MQPQHTIQSVPPSSFTLQIGNCQPVLTCLRKGASLQVLEGSVEASLGPLLYGQVLAARTLTLHPGQILEVDADESATWVRLQHRGEGMARLLCTEPAADPAWEVSKLIHALRRAWMKFQRWSRGVPQRGKSGLGRSQA